MWFSKSDRSLSFWYRRRYAAGCVISYLYLCRGFLNFGNEVFNRNRISGHRNANARLLCCISVPVGECDPDKERDGLPMEINSSVKVKDKQISPNVEMTEQILLLLHRRLLLSRFLFTCPFFIKCFRVLRQYYSFYFIKANRGKCFGSIFSFW